MMVSTNSLTSSDLLPAAKTTKLLKEAHTQEEIIAVLKTVADGRNPAMSQAAYKLQSINCLTEKVVDKLHTIWLNQGKPDRAVDDEFNRIIKNAKKIPITVARLVYEIAG